MRKSALLRVGSPSLEAKCQFPTNWWPRERLSTTHIKAEDTQGIQQLCPFVLSRCEGRTVPRTRNLDSKQCVLDRNMWYL